MHFYPLPFYVHFRVADCLAFLLGHFLFIQMQLTVSLLYHLDMFYECVHE